MKKLMVLLFALVFVMTSGCAFWLHDRLLDERRYDRKELRSNGQHYDGQGRDGQHNDGQSRDGQHYDGQGGDGRHEDDGSGKQKKLDDQRQNGDPGHDGNEQEHDRNNNNGN
jgi:hypothetical protein